MLGLGENDTCRSIARLRELGVDVRAAKRDASTRRAVTLVDGAGERTITTFGERLEPVAADDQLPWGKFEGMDAVFFTAGDLGALRAARAARVLVASPRAGAALGHGVPLDALALSGDDAIERRAAARAQDEAELVVSTEGERGGCSGCEIGTLAMIHKPGDPVDSYGCGDAFAAGLTYGLGAGMSVPAALALAARCGAVCVTGRGPYEQQLKGPIT